MKANTNATTLFAPTDGTMYRLFFDPTTNRLVTGVESDPISRLECSDDR